MRTRSQLMMILPRAARMKEVKTGSDILMRWVREAELTARLLLVISVLWGVVGLLNRQGSVLYFPHEMADTEEKDSAV